MNALDSVVREYVVPAAAAAAAAGFRKRGRMFWKANESRDYVILEFQTHAVNPDALVFDVEFHIVPEPYWDWVNLGHQRPGAVPDSSGALVSVRAIPPEAAAHHPASEMPFRARWALRSGDEASFGRLLSDELTERVFPRMQRLLDRDHLLEVLRGRDATLMKRMTPQLREILLRVDQLSLADLARLLAGLESTRAPAAFSRWAYDRVAARER